MIVLTLAACTGGSPPDTDTDVTVDPPSGTHVVGTVTVHKSVDGVPTCDYDLDFVDLRPFVGECLGCDFAFSILPDVTRDDSTDGCSLTDTEAALSLGPIGDEPRWLSWTTRWLEPGAAGYDLAYVDVLLAGTGYTYTPIAGSAGYWMTDHLAYDYPIGPGSAVYADGTLTFDATVDGTQAFREYGDTCGRTQPVGTPGTVVLADGERATGVIPGPGDVVDVWSFEVPADTPIAVSVDTEDASRWGPIDIDVVGTDGCVVVAGAGDDSAGAVACSAWPTDDSGSPVGWCAAWTFPSGSAGHVQVLVGAKGTAPAVAYTIAAVGASPGTLSLADDDVASTRIAPTTFAMTGSAVITP